MLDNELEHYTHNHSNNLEKHSLPVGPSSSWIDIRYQKHVNKDALFTSYHSTQLLPLHVKRRSAKTRQPVLTSLYRSVYMSEVIHVWQTRR